MEITFTYISILVKWIKLHFCFTKLSVCIMSRVQSIRFQMEMCLTVLPISCTSRVAAGLRCKEMSEVISAVHQLRSLVPILLAQCSTYIALHALLNRIILAIRYRGESAIYTHASQLCRHEDICKKLKSTACFDDLLIINSRMYLQHFIFM